MYREVLCIKRKEIPMGMDFGGAINTDNSTNSASSVQFRSSTGAETEEIEGKDKKIALVDDPKKFIMPEFATKAWEV